MKDDAALNAYLISNAVDGGELRYCTDAPPLTGQALEKLLLDYHTALDQIGRLGQRCDNAVLRAMLDIAPPLPEQWQQQPMSSSVAEAPDSARQRARSGQARLYVARARRQRRTSGRARHRARTSRHAHVQMLPAAFFAGMEFKPILDIARQLDGLIQTGADIRARQRQRADPRLSRRPTNGCSTRPRRAAPCSASRDWAK